MSDFPSPPDDSLTSSEENSSDETEENSSENDDSQNLSASALISALRDAEEKKPNFSDLTDHDRLEDDFIVKSFQTVSLFGIKFPVLTKDGA